MGASDIEHVEPSRELDRLAHVVIGAAIEVRRRLGPGFLESVDEEALCIELEVRGVPFQRQVPVAVVYRGRSVGESRLDLLVGGMLIVELKALKTVLSIHEAQGISYLKATQVRLGSLINFNVELLKHSVKRIILSP